MDAPHYEYLEKYFGHPDVRPLWENHSVKFQAILETTIAIMEQGGPILEEDVASIIGALQSFNNSNGDNQYFTLLDEANRNHWARNKYKW